MKDFIRISKAKLEKYECAIASLERLRRAMQFDDDVPDYKRFEYIYRNVQHELGIEHENKSTNEKLKNYKED